MSAEMLMDKLLSQNSDVNDNVVKLDHDSEAENHVVTIIKLNDHCWSTS